MKRKVQISLRGRQKTGDKPEEYELVTDGELEEKDGTVSVGYMESEITGLEGVKTVFEIQKNGCIVLSRTGAINAQLVFEEGRKHCTMYETPYGAISIGVTALEAAAEKTDGEMNISINYIVDVDSSEISRNIFKINVREV